MKISGCVPFYNNASTVLAAVESLRMQRPAPDEIIAIDDGSTDDGARLLEGIGVRVVRHPRNLGRGAARARAMAETCGDFVLSVDATKVLASDFLERALRHMKDPGVATVNGRNWQTNSNRSVERWRGRHLYRIDAPFSLDESAPLNTHGVLLRRSAIMSVGGFAVTLRHSEDAELGRRLVRAGWKVIFDPQILVHERATNRWGQVYERQWRYYVGIDDRLTARAWWAVARMAWTVMLKRDRAAADMTCAAATALYPIYALAFWHCWRGHNLR